MSIMVFSGTDIGTLRQRDALLAECVRLGECKFGTVKDHLPLPNRERFTAIEENEINILGEGQRDRDKDREYMTENNIKSLDSYVHEGSKSAYFPVL